MKACPACEKNDFGGKVYADEHPDHYDGVSEWVCLACGARIGRWSGRVLQEGETEPRKGGGARA